MAWNQVVAPNLGVSGDAGWCLIYVRNVFGAPAGWASAQISWDAAKQRGTAHVGDRNLPNVAVPLYFSWKTDGHVAVWVPGQGIFSTPWRGSGHQVFPSIEALEKSMPGTYLGWAEDVNTKRVVAYAPDPVPAGNPSSGIVARNGVATVTVATLNVRNAPNTNGAPVASYAKGQSFNYTGFVDANGYRWLTYISYSGVRRYIAQSGSDGSYVSGGVS